MIGTTNPRLALLAQESLARRGFYAGVLDGEWGPVSARAFAAFEQTYHDSGAAEPKWLAIARAEMGVSEMLGPKANNPRIVEYHQATSLGARDDETPWCASFVNWCLRAAGVKGTGSAAARSFLEWGRPIVNPLRGCIVVFTRGGGGHVAFFIGSEGATVNVLGGNQGDRVCIAGYALDRVIGYRVPNDALCESSGRKKTQMAMPPSVGNAHNKTENQ